MELDAFFEHVLESMTASYDVLRDAQVVSRRVDALARLRALNPRYVLNKKHVLWEANAYDHALILKVQTLTAEMVEDWFAFMTQEAEASLVHPGAKCPPEGHMASTLTLILLCHTVEPEADRAVRRARFSKSYYFSLRGWVTGRIAAADMGSGCVYASRDAKDLKAHLLGLMQAQ